MSAAVHFGTLAALTDAERAVSRALAAAVYPPEAVANWSGNHLDWSNVEWCVRVFDEAGAQVSYAGVLVRDATLDGGPVRVGGIGGVRTHPDARRRGYAALAMRRAVEFFGERG